MSEANDSRKKLTSWKEIANFLGVSQRTAQYWEREKGLPVERLSGVKGRVSADTDALERWREANLRRSPWYLNSRFLRSYGAIASALLLLAAGIQVRNHFVAQHDGPPARYKVDFNTLIVSDNGGQDLWKYRFQDPMDGREYNSYDPHYFQFFWVGKLNPEDRQLSVLFLYYPTTVGTKGTKLICFSEAGEMLWSFVPGRQVADRDKTYSPPFTIANFRVGTHVEGERSQILVTSHHWHGDPNQFAILDGRGNLLSEYWHSGFLPYIGTEDVNGDGIKEIFLAGINNGYGCATLVMLDPRNVNGASEQGPDDHSQLTGFRPGTENVIVRFPKTLVAQNSILYNKVVALVVTKDSVRVDIAESDTDYSAVVIYEFHNNLSRWEITVSDHLQNVYRDLFLKKVLARPFSPGEVSDLSRNLQIVRR